MKEEETMFFHIEKGSYKRIRSNFPRSAESLNQKMESKDYSYIVPWQVEER